MPVGERCGDATARRSLEEAVLNEERLVHLLDGRGILADRGANVVESDRSTLEFLDDRLEDSRIHVVEPELVHVDYPEELRRDLLGYHAIRLHLGVIAD